MQLSKRESSEHGSSESVQDCHAAYLDATIVLEEAFRGAFAVDEGSITLVDIRRQQIGAVSVCAGDEHGGHAADISCQPGRHQGAHKLTRWQQHLNIGTARSVLLRQDAYVLSRGRDKLLVFGKLRLPHHAEDACHASIVGYSHCLRS